MQNTMPVAPASDQNTLTDSLHQSISAEKSRGRDRNSDATRASFDGNRPRSYDKNRGNRGRNQPRFDAPQSSSTEAFGRTPVRCKICHKAGHSAANCYFRYSQSRNGTTSHSHSLVFISHHIRISIQQHLLCHMIRIGILIRVQPAT